MTLDISEDEKGLILTERFPSIKDILVFKILRNEDWTPDNKETTTEVTTPYKYEWIERVRQLNPDCVFSYALLDMVYIKQERLD